MKINEEKLESWNTTLDGYNLRKSFEKAHGRMPDYIEMEEDYEIVHDGQPSEDTLKAIEEARDKIFWLEVENEKYKRR